MYVTDACVFSSQSCGLWVSLLCIVGANHVCVFVCMCARKCLSLSAAVCHSIDLIHTDLKPENILLVHSDYREIDAGAQRHPYAPPPLPIPKHTGMSVCFRWGFLIPVFLFDFVCFYRFVSPC
jgi:serine/threonine protein kinase